MNEHKHTFEVGDSTETVTKEGSTAHAIPDDSEVAERFGVDEEDVTWALTEEVEATGNMMRSGAIPCIECHRPVWKVASHAREQYENEYPKSTCGRCVRARKDEQGDADTSEV